MIVCKTNVLNEAQQQQVAALARLVQAADGIQAQDAAEVFNAENGGEPCIYRGFEQEELIAFLCVGESAQGEVKIIAFVHPQYRRHGCFTTMLRMALADRQAQPTQRVSFVPQSEAASAFLQKYQTVQDGAGEHIQVQNLLPQKN